MHRECLKAYLVKLSERNEDATRHVCPRCHEPFRVVMTHRFVCDCAHVCTPRALNNMFELVIVGFTLLCCASVFMVLDYDVRWPHPDALAVSVMRPARSVAPFSQSLTYRMTRRHWSASTPASGFCTAWG